MQCWVETGFMPNSCVLTSFHQYFLLWQGNELQVIWGDKQPFTVNSNVVEAS